MTNGLDLKQLVQSLNTGVAVIDDETWSIIFENGNFFQWFPPGADPDAPLAARLPALNIERAKTRLRDRGRFTFETEAKAGGRSVPLRVDLRLLADAAQASILLECTDISKEKEASYMLESYSKMSEKHRKELEREKERVEKLLLNIMPKPVYEELKDFGTTTPQRFDCATILILDFVGFTSMAISQDPSALVSELNDIFSAFDRISEMFGCDRLKTIGDAYMAVSGLPEANTEHAHNVAKVALRMRRYLDKRNAAHPQQWRCRIGINSGPVIGSLVGVQKYVYDLFGPGVNLAARMESMSEPMRITVSQDTQSLIKDDFALTERGEFDIKGFGKQTLYYLDSEHR